MKEYKVQWEIDVVAENPREAAKAARKAQTAKGTLATVFDVFEENGSKNRIDLEAQTEWSMGLVECTKCGKVREKLVDEMGIGPDKSYRMECTKCDSRWVYVLVNFE